MNLKKFAILNFGKKRAKVKIDKKKYKFSYLSKKEYKNEVEKAEKADQYTRIIGYTTLKQRSDSYIQKNKDSLVGLLTNGYSSGAVTISTIEKKKKKWRYTKGYFDIGSNRFVAIQKFNPLFLLLFLFIGLICLVTALGFFGNDDEPIKPWKPVLEEILDDDKEKKDEIPQIQVAGFSSWHIPSGQTENIPVSLSNPKDNPCYFSFEIRLKDTNEVLYTSNMVAPGNEIKRININKPLNSGEYTALVHISTNELETGTEMNDASFEVNLTVD